MAYSNTTGLPSPSDILRPWIDATWFTDESRDRGTITHQACADHLLGCYVIIQRQYRGYFDSFKRWCDREKPRPIIADGKPLIERRLIHSTFQYCGQPDLPCWIESQKGVPGVVDLKTGVALGKAWPLQIAAYRGLVDQYKTTGWGLSIRLRSSGKEPQVKMYDNQEIYFNTFLGCLNAYNHFK